MSFFCCANVSLFCCERRVGDCASDSQKAVDDCGASHYNDDADADDDDDDGDRLSLGVVRSL